MTEVESYCKHCETKIGPTSKYCHNCGRATGLQKEGEKTRSADNDKEETTTPQQKIIIEAIECPLSTGQRVVKGLGIALLVIGAFWGLFAAPIAAIYGEAPVVATRFVIVALVLSLISVPLFYFSRKKKDEITAIFEKKNE